MIKTWGYAAHKAKAPLAPFTFEHRDPRQTDVVIDIQFCGVCHSDLHQVRDEWSEGIFPMVPGHEIVGTVVKVGSEVKNFKAGDKAGVGCLVDSCRTCPSCGAGEEQYCEVQMVPTYNGTNKDGSPTYGGYSNNIIVDQDFVLKISPNADLAKTAPLLCAGITTYSPLRYWKIGKGSKVGVVGLGGLGHMALKLAHSFGAHVVQFTTSLNKKDDALRLGANEVVLSTDPEQMAAHANTFDFILDTVSGQHDVAALMQLLKREGTLTMVGLPNVPPVLPAMELISKRRSLAGSLIGGIRETQEMLDYCAEHNITSDVEVIPIDKINEAYERMLRSDVKYRFVIDMSTLKKS